MSDRYLHFSHSPVGRQLSSLLGLPKPPRLVRAPGRYRSEPLSGHSVLVGADLKARQGQALVAALAAAGAELVVDPAHSGFASVKRAAAALSVPVAGLAPELERRLNAIVFDASGAAGAGDLRAVYDLLHAHLERLVANGRVVLLASAAQRDPGAAAAAWGLRGITRSLAKELGRRGIAVNGIELAAEAEAGLAGALRFLLSEHSAFVTGQTLLLDASVETVPASFVMPLADRVALVTGAARGIGAAIAITLAREGASVIGVDRPGEEAGLAETLGDIQGRALLLDVGAEKAADQIAEETGILDIVVHNAGITHDRTLKNLAPEWWDQVLEINLGAVLRIDQRLLDGVLAERARMVCIASINGIAGAAGQTHYAATKAGLMGYVDAMAPRLARIGGAINAVAPGFIETRMTAAMPRVPREFGRRLNSFSQGGLPIDVAEAVSFLASPLAAGINGRTLRVCGQNLVGA